MTATPFSLVYDGLWTLMLRKSTFTDLVEANNRISFTSDLRRPQKDSLTEIDVPEVMVYPAGNRYAELRDSSQQSINKVYAILLTTGNRAFDEAKLFEVEWAISRAMMDFDTLMDLEYESQKFVIKLEIPNAEEGLTDTELSRDLAGWTCVWQVDVTMSFTNNIWRGG